MKKTLKYIGLTVAVLVLLIAIVLLYVASTDIPTYETKAVNFTLKSSPEAIERGAKLSSMLCSSCHLNPETGRLSGKNMRDVPKEFGVINSQNITNDKTVGIGGWTDSELVYLFRTGIKRDGQYAPPYMPKFALMGDEDINAIVAFLRSDNPLVVADPRVDEPCEPSFITKLLTRVAWKPFPFPTSPIAMPDTTNALQLGEYLAHNLDCFSCHSADFKTNNFLEPKRSEGYFGGGNKPLDQEGRVMLTQNLTPDKETGIGNWSKQKFINAVKYGLKEGDRALLYPMLPHSQLTDNEAGSIFDYLQTIPPIKNKVPRSEY
jgi:mono/diheme cytochrome c family protein